MKVYLSSKADKQLNKLPNKMHELLLAHIKKLQNNPLPGHTGKLMNREGWRLRVGDYRILYTIDSKNKEIIVLSVAHRKEAYRN